MKSIKIFLFILLAFFVGNISSVNADSVTVTATITVVTDLPTVTTTAPTAITSTTATVGGNVTVAGSYPVTERGVVWNTTGNPRLFNFLDKKKDASIGLGSFSFSISGLTPNITYYIAAYATNSDGTSYGGTSYGNDMMFKTPINIIPAVTTPVPSNITTTSATLGATVSVIGNPAATARGVCWSKVDPTDRLAQPFGSTSAILGSGCVVVPAGVSLGAYTMNTGLVLAPNTTYKFVGYIYVNSGTPYYTSQGTFTTLAKETPSCNVNNSPVDYNGSTQTPTVAITNSLGAVVPGTTTVHTGTSPINAGSYSVTADFTPTDAIKYNSFVGKSCSNFIINKIDQTTPLVITGQTVTSPNPFASLTTSTSGGNGTGGITYTIPGMPTGTLSPSISGSTLTYTGIGSAPVRATKAGDTNYNALISNIATFTVIVPGTPPSISNTTSSAMTCNSITLGANVTAQGTSAVTSRGICYIGYGTASYYPTKIGTCTDVGSGTGPFTLNVTGLTPSASYTFLGYASNASGPNQTTPATAFSTPACASPLDITVNPATYSVTLPSSTISAVYTLTNGTSANTNCRLLDYLGAPLTAYAPCTSPMSVVAPNTSSGGNYDYYIQAFKNLTSETKTSNRFTVTVNPVAVKANQIGLNLSDQTINNGDSFINPLVTTGGSGTGAVSYNVIALGNSAGCSLSGAILSYASIGSCGVVATKAADVNYNSATTTGIFMVITALQSATIDFRASSDNVTFNDNSVKTKINTGGNVWLRWITSNAQAGSCSLTAGSVATNKMSPQSNNSTQSFSPAKDVRYTLTCTGNDGSSTQAIKDVYVGNINPTYQER